MKTQSDVSPRPGLDPVLRQLRRRIRRVQGGRGALITLVTALAALLVLVLVDYRFSPLPQFARWMLTIGWAVAVVVVAYTAWWWPLRRPLELVRIARWLEIRHPELDERVSTVLELGAGDTRGMSRGLLDELARAAVVDLAGINPRVEVSNRRMRRWLVPALGLLAGWLGLLVIAPDWTARHLVRALVPGSSLGNTAGVFTVEPGSVELIEGDPLRLKVGYQGERPEALEVVLHLADGALLTERLREEAGSHIYQLDKAVQGFDYEIRAGRESSDRFRVTVWPRPRLADARVSLEYPAYTGLARSEQGVGDGIVAVAGTRVELRARLNTPVQTARFEIDGAETGTIQHEHSAAGGALTVRWPLATPGRREARLLLKHRLGREFEALRFMVETLADTPPEVKWISPAATKLRVRPDEVLGLVYQATDDLGLGAVRMEVDPTNGRGAELPQDMPAVVGRATPPVWRGGIRQAVGALRQQWPRAGTFKLRMRVDDSRPAELGGPGTAVSDWLTIHLDQGAEPLARQEVFAAHNDARETLEKARQEIEQAGWKMDARRDDLRKGEPKEGARNELAKAREQLAEAREQLGQLADRMEETPHAAKADEVREAAATTEEARRKLEETPLQDTEQARGQMAEQAKQSANRAEQQLRKLLDEIQRAEPQLQDLAKLLDLEQRQQELAREAGQQVAESQPAAPLPDEWRQRQAETARELRDLTAQHPEARAEALANQAQHARDLAAAAREQAANQQALKDAAQAAAADPDAAPGLREQLAKEQAAIRDAVNEQLDAARERGDQATANALPEAAQSTAEAAKTLQQEDAAAPAAAEQAAAAAHDLTEVATAAADRSGQQGQADEGKENPPDNPPQAGQPEGASEQAQQAGEQATAAEPSGQPGEQAPAAEPAGQSEAKDGQQAANAQAAGELGELAERQQQVAGALSQLAAGNEAAAREQLAELRAGQAAELAQAVKDAPQATGQSGLMQQAAQASGEGAKQAGEAAAQAQAQPNAAAGQHEAAARQLQQAAANLDQAAADYANQAGQAAGQPSQPQQAPMPGQALAEAASQASQAATSPPPATAAAQAQAAAAALAQASRGTRRAMQQGGPPKPGGPPGMPQPGTEPGTQPDENSRNRQADPGVPPELAKLGISGDDWEQIKSALKAETGGASGVPLPEEYRELVRLYFEQMTREGGGK